MGGAEDRVQRLAVGLSAAERHRALLDRLQVLLGLVELDRSAWAELGAATEQPLTPEEIQQVRGLSDRLDLDEVEQVYLPLSRLLSLYVVATQRLFRAQQGFLGTEDAKGHDLAKETHALFAQSHFKDQFIGNIEGRDIHRGVCDVVVTDGYTGNIALKTAEGTARQIACDADILTKVFDSNSTDNCALGRKLV